MKQAYEQLLIYRLDRHNKPKLLVTYPFKETITKHQKLHFQLLTLKVEPYHCKRLAVYCKSQYLVVISPQNLLFRQLNL